MSQRNRDYPPRVPSLYTEPRAHLTLPFASARTLSLGSTFPVSFYPRLSFSLSLFRPSTPHTYTYTNTRTLNSPTRAREYSPSTYRTIHIPNPHTNPYIHILLTHVCKSRRVNFAFLRVFGNPRTRTTSHPRTRKRSCLSDNCFILLFHFTSSLPIPIPSLHTISCILYNT